MKTPIENTTNSLQEIILTSENKINSNGPSIYNRNKWRFPECTKDKNELLGEFVYIVGGESEIFFKRYQITEVGEDEHGIYIGIGIKGNGENKTIFFSKSLAKEKFKKEKESYIQKLKDNFTKKIESIQNQTLDTTIETQEKSTVGFKIGDEVIYEDDYDDNHSHYSSISINTGKIQSLELLYNKITYVLDNHQRAFPEDLTKCKKGDE